MKSVIIIGGGASVQIGTKLDLWNKIQGLEIWSLNSVYKCMPYLPTAQFWVDVDFFKHDIVDLQALYNKGVKLVSKEHVRMVGLKGVIEQWPTSREIDKYYGKEAISKHMIYYGRMGLCGMFALSYAIANGYDRIFLLGYDFGSTSLNNKLTHWYQEDMKDKNIYSTGAGKPEVYLQSHNDGQTNPFVEDFGVYAKETDIQIFNISLASNINYFPKLSYTDFLEIINANVT